MFMFFLPIDFMIFYPIKTEQSCSQDLQRTYRSSPLRLNNNYQVFINIFWNLCFIVYNRLHILAYESKGFSKYLFVFTVHCISIMWYFFGILEKKKKYLMKLMSLIFFLSYRMLCLHHLQLTQDLIQLFSERE